MNDTRQTIDKILAELESTSNPVGAKKSMKQVMDILLNRKEEAATEAEAPVVSHVPTYSQNQNFDMAELRRWQERNNQIYHMNTDYPLPAGRGLPGKIELFMKKLVRKMIRPILFFIVARQNEFNASVTASINALYNNEQITDGFMRRQESCNANLEQLKGQMALLQAELEGMKQANAMVCNELEGMKQINAGLNAELEDMRQNNAGLNAKVCNELKNLQQRNVKYDEKLEKIDKINAEVFDELSLLKKAEDDVYSILDYEKFESHFRGSKEDIKNRQRIYIPYFQGKGNIVDLGCGRGEFLELMKESNIPAVGVDAYAAFVTECQKKNLNVVNGDALEYVEQQETESLGGIFAAQLAEHLKTTDLVRLCRAAYDKLQFGGHFILETPNPTCLAIYTNFFYVDPTHIKPVHPMTLEYILRDAGFTSIEVLFTDSSRVGYRLPLLDMEDMSNLQEVNASINKLSDLLYGSQDYAIIATK